MIKTIRILIKELAFISAFARMIIVRIMTQKIFVKIIK